VVAGADAAVTVVRISLAVAVGLLLAAVPFLRYAHVGERGIPHANHEPQHGGQLGMAGDYHIEITRQAGTVDVYVSDAWRRSVQPRSGWLVFDGAATTPLTWASNRLVGADAMPAREIEAIVVLADGSRVAMSFDFSPER
jgi:hypothetical protein